MWHDIEIHNDKEGHADQGNGEVVQMVEFETVDGQKGPWAAAVSKAEA